MPPIYIYCINPCPRKGFLSTCSSDMKPSKFLGYHGNHSLFCNHHPTSLQSFTSLHPSPNELFWMMSLSSTLDFYDVLHYTPTISPRVQSESYPIHRNLTRKDPWAQDWWGSVFESKWWKSMWNSSTSWRPSENQAVDIGNTYETGHCKWVGVTGVPTYWSVLYS